MIGNGGYGRDAIMQEQGILGSRGGLPCIGKLLIKLGGGKRGGGLTLLKGWYSFRLLGGYWILL